MISGYLRKVEKKICENCKKEYFSHRKEARFCRVHCSTNPQGRILKNQSNRSKLHFCVDCGKKNSFKADRCLSCASKIRKYSELTRKKISENTKGEKNRNWAGGKSFEVYTKLFNRQLKDRVRTRDNFKCQLCGTPELECKKRLSIHHINYNKQNNELTNLVSLCMKCHARTTHMKNKEYWVNLFSKPQAVGYLALNRK